MKRICLLFVSIMMLALVTGCGGTEKKMNCTMTANDNGIDITQVFSLNFDKSEKFTTAILKQDMVLSAELLETMSLKDFQDAYANVWEATEYGKLKYKMTDNGEDKITLTVDIDANSLETITGGKTSKNDFEESKKALEEGGYTCKVVK